MRAWLVASLLLFVPGALGVRQLARELVERQIIPVPAQGPTGPTGATGPTGVTGATGATGAAVVNTQTAFIVNPSGTTGLVTTATNQLGGWEVQPDGGGSTLVDVQIYGKAGARGTGTGTFFLDVYGYTNGNQANDGGMCIASFSCDGGVGTPGASAVTIWDAVWPTDGGTGGLAGVCSWPPGTFISTQNLDTGASADCQATAPTMITVKELVIGL